MQFLIPVINPLIWVLYILIAFFIPPTTYRIYIFLHKKTEISDHKSHLSLKIIYRHQE